MNNEHENLNELLSNFYDEQQADEFKDNLSSFDEMLSSAPAPSPQIIDDIKVVVAEKLSSRKHNRFTVLPRIAVAAIVLLIAFAGLKIGSRQPVETAVMKTVTVAGLFDDADTAQILSLTEQIEQLEDELLSVRLDEYDPYKSDSYSELETELNEINGDFWKG